MSIFDEKQNPFNIPFPTAGGKVFWDELDAREGYVLQRHSLTGHCRILNDDRFILKIKQEFIENEIAERVQTEISEVNALYGTF